MQPILPEDLIRTYPEIDFLVAEGRVSSDYMVAIHKAFYEFAASQLDGESVLDVGCGTGFGTTILARRSPIAVGLDMKPLLLRYARQTYGMEGMNWMRADAGSLAFADGALDAVVADELLEHLPDHVPFLDEAARVLRPDGVFVCATVNASHSFGSRSNPLNRNHFREFDAASFQSELSRWFDRVTLFGQRIGPRYHRYMSSKAARAIEWGLMQLNIKHRIPARLRARVRGKITGVQSTDAAQEDFAVVSDDPSASLYLVAVARGRGPR